MKRFGLLVALMMALSAPVYSLSLGDEAPTFKLKEINSGETIDLSKYRGKVVMVNFWATWCPPCRAEIPDMVKLQKDYSNDLVIIGVSLDRDGVKKVKDFARTYNINYPVVMGDYDLTTRYGGVRAIPTTFVLYQDGDIAQKIVGARSYEGFENVIKPLLEE